MRINVQFNYIVDCTSKNMNPNWTRLYLVQRRPGGQKVPHHFLKNEPEMTESWPDPKENNVNKSAWFGKVIQTRMWRKLAKTTVCGRISDDFISTFKEYSAVSKS